jgi:SAM-dependent methyltransferase
VPGNETDIAIDRLLDGFKGDRWFIDQYWPENSRRVLMMLIDARARLSPRSSKVLDIGCGKGYISSLFAMHDFKVTATDSWAIIDAGDIQYRGPAQGGLKSKSELFLPRNYALTV